MLTFKGKEDVFTLYLFLHEISEELWCSPFKKGTVNNKWFSLYSTMNLEIALGWIT